MRHHKEIVVKKPRKFNQHLQQILGQVGVMLGESAERRVNEAFNEARDEGRLPEWITRWDQHEKWSAEDMAGIDFTFFTDVGPIFVQIKSCARNAIRFQNNRQGRKVICVVVIDVRENNLIIYDNVMYHIGKQRAEFLARRTAFE